MAEALQKLPHQTNQDTFRDIFRDRWQNHRLETIWGYVCLASIMGGFVAKACGALPEFDFTSGTESSIECSDFGPQDSLPISCVISNFIDQLQAKNIDVPSDIFGLDKP